jgi:hypothetical protein
MTKIRASFAPKIDYGFEYYGETRPHKPWFTYTDDWQQQYTSVYVRRFELTRWIRRATNWNYLASEEVKRKLKELRKSI